MARAERERYKRGESAEIGHFHCGKGGRNGQGERGRERYKIWSTVGRSELPSASCARCPHAYDSPAVPAMLCPGPGGPWVGAVERARRGRRRSWSSGWVMEGRGCGERVGRARAERQEEKEKGARGEVAVGAGEKRG